MSKMRERVYFDIPPPSRPGEWQIVQPPMAPQVGYKYIKWEDRHFIEDGDIRVGSFYGYRQIDGFRADPDEAKGFYETVGRSFTGGAPGSLEHDLISRTGGIVGEGATVIFKDARWDIQTFDSYCFCCSVQRDIRDPEGTKLAVYRIANLGRLKRALEDQHQTLKNRITRSGRVIYKSRSMGDPFEIGTYGPSPFIKPERLCFEREVRFAWATNQTVGVAPLTGSNPEIAGHFKFIGSV